MLVLNKNQSIKSIFSIFLLLLINQFSFGQKETSFQEHKTTYSLIKIDSDYFPMKSKQNSKLFYKTKLESLNKELKLNGYRDSIDTFRFNIKKTDSTFYIKTFVRGDSMETSNKLLKKEDFLLINRGFQWINENVLIR